MTIRRAAIAAALGGCLLAAGCGEGGDQAPRHEGSDAHASVGPLDPALLEAPQVAANALQIILSWQPAVDGGRSDALRRTIPWLGGQLLEDAQVPARESSGVRPDREWERWKENHDVLSAVCVQAESTPAAPEGMRTLFVDMRCTQTVLHTSGQSTPLEPVTWRTTVTRTDDGWRMTDYRYRS